MNRIHNNFQQRTWRKHKNSYPEPASSKLHALTTEVEIMQSTLSQYEFEIQHLKTRLSQEQAERQELACKLLETQKYCDYLYYKGIHPDYYEHALKDWYYQKTKKNLNLCNPQTFNEKIQWLKLHDSTPQKTLLADKLLVRNWIKDKIGSSYLIPLLGAWDRFDEINFRTLPEQFILKTNHGSGWNYIVRDKNLMNYSELKIKFDNWMRTNFAFVAGYELHYMNIPRKIIAEQYIADLDNDIYDYRFFCFNGKPKYIWVDIGSGTTHHQRNIYDLNWDIQDLRVNYPPIVPAPPKPNCLKEMISIAEILCKDFSFVRVDLYSVNNKIYFGEMTFTPQSGIGRWIPESENLSYGELLQLPNITIRE